MASRVVVASFLGLLVSFLSASVFLYYLARYLLPASSDGSELKYPASLPELQSLAHSLNGYRRQHPVEVTVVFCVAYIYKQSFAIPGSALLNLLAGALFGLWFGFPLVCFLTACGSSCCYLLSLMFGRPLLENFFPKKLNYLQNMISSNNHRLFFFLISLRLLPVTPNWLLNVVSPLANVPLEKFFLSMFFGLMPYNFLCCQGGLILSTLTSVQDIFSLQTFLLLVTMAAVALLPGLLAKQPGSSMVKSKRS